MRGGIEQLQGGKGDGHQWSAQLPADPHVASAARQSQGGP